MKHRLTCTVLAVVFLLSSSLFTINVRAQDSGVGYITFSSNRSGNYDIYMIDRHGENLQRLIGGRANEVHARWSPNGRFLAYASNENAAFYDIYVMDMRNKRRCWRRTHRFNSVDNTSVMEHVACVGARTILLGFTECREDDDAVGSPQTALTA